jgi:hypothetical protein
LKRPTLSLAHNSRALPADCFKLEEVELLQSFDGKVLTDVEYYVWMHAHRSEQIHYQFLLCLELVFDSETSLLLTSGENSMSISVTNAAELSKMADRLKKINGIPLIRRVNVNVHSLWNLLIGTPLNSIQLSRHPASEYYANDAVLFDFGAKRILLCLGIKEGLELSEY